MLIAKNSTQCLTKIRTRELVIATFHLVAILQVAPDECVLARYLFAMPVPIA